MRTVLILVLALIGGCPQAKVANYAPDDAATAYKLARGEASIWDGITVDDRAAYERVKRKLNERTDREADNFADAPYRVAHDPVSATPRPSSASDAEYLHRLWESGKADREEADRRYYDEIERRTGKKIPASERIPRNYPMPGGDGQFYNGWEIKRIKEGPDC